MAETYMEVLTQAVDDLVEHGYDDPGRVARWQERLTAAARQSHMGLDRVTQELREALRRRFDDYVGGDRALKAHSGIDRFTYERIKPRLRVELDKRLMASMDLIRLNREQMIARQAQRFAGWATSIPVGGPAEAKKREVKQAIRRPLASLPFEERRVMIDQGHKLVSAVNLIIATDGGAIAARWRAVHQPGYDHRPEHLERDGLVYLVRGSWAAERGLVRPVHGYTDDVDQPAEKVFCRCGWIYLYNLRQLPDDMLTAKGRAALELVRARMDA